MKGKETALHQELCVNYEALLSASEGTVSIHDPRDGERRQIRIIPCAWM